SIDGFIYMRRFPNGTFVDLSNQLEWSEDFLIKYLNCKIDPQNARDHMLIQPGVSLWSHNPKNTIWNEGRTNWGFQSGISIAKEGPFWTDIFCFYSKTTPIVMDAKFLGNFYHLEKFSLCFTDKFHDIIKKGEKAPLITPSIYLSNENSTPPSTINPKLKKSINDISQLEPLSYKERECIYYTAKGNTAFQVGKIMHISRRTVETHLQTARDKLSVSKTSDLVKLFPEW
ncbi:LuxR C-terminal-related transcriptional regulator, partial [Chlamydiales bacterium]|nr:LuxR C-terminal-related transcriptional regulator [Chlamydiales bacterium]